MTIQKGPQAPIDAVRTWLNERINGLRTNQDEASLKLSALYVTILIELSQIHTRGQMLALKQRTQEGGLMSVSEFNSLFELCDTLYPKLRLTESASEDIAQTQPNAATFTPGLLGRSASASRINYLRRSASSGFEDPDVGEAYRIPRTPSLTTVSPTKK